MPYQNNNNRIVPKEVGLTSITPVASPVEQEIKYVNNNTKAQNYQNLANSLYALGKGITDFDAYMRNEAKFAASAEILSDDLENNNKHDWKVAQERITGLRKFNPYVKDSYKKLAAQDFAQGIINGLTADPNTYKLTNTEYNKRIKDGEAELQKLCKEAGIDVRQAATTFNSFNSAMNKLRGDYVAKNAQYTHNLGIAQLTSQLTTEAYNTINSKGDVNQLLTTFTATNSTLPKDEQLSIISNAGKALIQRMAVDENFKPDLAVLTDTLGNYKVEGVSLKDLDTDFAYNMKQYYNSAKHQAIVDMQQEYQVRKMKEQENIEAAEKELAQFSLDNPNVTTDDFQSKVNEITQKYDVPETASKFVMQNLQYRQALAQADVVKTDYDTYTQILGMMGLADYETVNQAITEAIDSRSLSKQDAASLWNKNLTEYNRSITKAQVAEQQAQKAQEKQNKDAIKLYNSTRVAAEKLIKNKSYMEKLNKIDRNTANTFADEITNIVAEATAAGAEDTETVAACTKRIQSLIDLGNKLTQEYNNNLKQNGILIDYSNRKGRDIITKDVLAATAGKFFNANFYKQQFAQGNVTEDTDTILNGYQAAALGVLNPSKANNISKYGSLVNTSPMTKKRTINGKTSAHKAYDYRAKAGEGVSLPRNTSYAVCVDSYKGGSNKGNGAAFACYDRNKKLIGYVRYFHLDETSLPSRGMSYTTWGNNRIRVARVGAKDGKSTGSHLDVIFFNDKGWIITDEQALKLWGIDGFSDTQLKAKMKK